ncbi:MAG: adenylate kinase family protein [Candidatus Heimdallarchaeota archaeon]
MKIVTISGTPGTGKTSVSKAIAEKLNAKLISLNDLVIQKNFTTNYDSKRDTFIFNEKAVKKYLINLIESYEPEKVNYLLIESHFSDIIPEKFIDFLIILRCHPDELSVRLRKKGYNEEKVIENVQSEILGNCINFFIKKDVKIPILEIDTTKLDIETLMRIIIEIITEEKNIDQYIVGKIDWLEDLFQQDRLGDFFD